MSQFNLEKKFHDRIKSKPCAKNSWKYFKIKDGLSQYQAQQKIQKKDPVYWVWEKDQIKRIKFDPIQSKEIFLDRIKIPGNVQ